MPITNRIADMLFSKVITRSAMKIALQANKAMMDLEAFALGMDLQGANARTLIFGGESIVANTILEAFRTAATRITEGTITEAWGEGMHALQMQGDAGKAYRWQVESANPCPDCIARSGEVRTMDEWEDVGTPRSGFSVCGPNCKCILVPTDTPSMFS